MNELRFTIPAILMEEFQKDARILVRYRPDGIWPINPEMLQKPDFLAKLATREFTSKFEIIISPKELPQKVR